MKYALSIAGLLFISGCASVSPPSVELKDPQMHDAVIVCGAGADSEKGARLNAEYNKVNLKVSISTSLFERLSAIATEGYKDEGRRVEATKVYNDCLDARLGRKVVKPDASDSVQPPKSP